MEEIERMLDCTNNARKEEGKSCESERCFDRVEKLARCSYQAEKWPGEGRNIYGEPDLSHNFSKANENPKA